jgi:hypothetical protein
MRTIKDFNEVYSLIIDGAGLGIEIPQVVGFLSVVFDDLCKIEGFRLTEISTVRGIPRMQSNLVELMPWVGNTIHAEIEEKIIMIMKVEFELEKRLQSLNLDKNGKPLEHE